MERQPQTGPDREVGNDERHRHHPAIERGGRDEDQEQGDRTQARRPKTHQRHDRTGPEREKHADELAGEPHRQDLHAHECQPGNEAWHHHAERPRRDKRENRVADHLGEQRPQGRVHGRPDTGPGEPGKREIPRPDDEGRCDDRDPVARKDPQRTTPGEGHRARSLAALQQQIPGEPEERHDRDGSAVAGLPAGQNLHGIRAEPADWPGVKDDHGRGKEEPQRGDAVRTVAIHSPPPSLAPPAPVRWRRWTLPEVPIENSVPKSGPRRDSVVERHRAETTPASRW